MVISARGACRSHDIKVCVRDRWAIRVHVRRVEPNGLRASSRLGREPWTAGRSAIQMVVQLCLSVSSESRGWRCREARCDADGLLVVVCVMYLSCMCVSESLASLGHSIRLLSIDRESNRQKKFRRSRRGGEPRPRELDRRRGGEERPRESDRRRRPASPPFSPPFGGGLASSSSSW